MSIASALVLSLALASNNDAVLLEFTAEWCGPCRVMAPTIERLVSAGYPVRQIDVDRDARTAARFRVDSVPCFVMLVDGHEVERVTGAVSHDRLIQMYQQSRSRAARPGTSSTPRPDTRQNVVRAQSPDETSSTAGALGHSHAGAANFPHAHAPQHAHARAPQHAALGAPRSKQLSALPPITGSPQRPAGIDPSDARATAFQATVRLKVEDPNGHGYGTGTIIDVHGSEALVVTCGHLFRDSAGKGNILVDLFNGAQVRSVPGQLISYDLERDIALVSMSPGQTVAVAPVAASGQGLAPGTAVFSIGCDKGQPPSIRGRQVTAIDRYLGPPNIEVAGQPIDGRSGGGLFASDGRLIGICNAADPADNEGIYAGLPTIHWELDRIGQRHIYASTGQPLLADSNHLPPVSRVQPLAAQPTAPPHMPERMPAATAASAVSLNDQRQGDLGPDTEVICIIRSRHDPQGQQRLLVLDRPSADLLDRLRKESQHGAAAASVARNPAPRRLRGTDPVIRAQSADR